MLFLFLKGVNLVDLDVRNPHFYLQQLLKISHQGFRILSQFLGQALIELSHEVFDLLREFSLALFKISIGVVPILREVLWYIGVEDGLPEASSLYLKKLLDRPVEVFQNYIFNV